MSLRRRLPPAVLVLAAGIGLAAGQEAVPRVEGRVMPTSESEDRHFVVHGGDLRLRSAVLRMAEDTKEALVKAVGAGEGWKHVIVIQLQAQPEGDRRPRSFQLRVQALPQGFRLQVNIYNLDRGLDRAGLERAVLQLLVFERTLRDEKSEGFDQPLSVPWWLTEGLLESFRWKRGEGDRDLYAALFKSQGVFSVERLLEVDDVDLLSAGERSAFRASAGALVMALLGQEGGREGMAGLLGEVAVFEGQPKALLSTHFPGMNLGQNSLGKWWALQLAKMAEPPVTQTMTVLESEAELERILVVRYGTAEEGMIEFRPAQFRDLLAIPAAERIELLKSVTDQLNLMAFRAFPGYRPIIFGYLTVLTDLARGQDAEIESRLASLDARRGEMVELGKRVRDLLDWYRITSARKTSGEFSTYLELRRQLDAERSETRGPLEDYLRDMQRIYDAGE